MGHFGDVLPSQSGFSSITIDRSMWIMVFLPDRAMVLHIKIVEQMKQFNLASYWRNRNQHSKKQATHK